jgi:cysteine desulfurase
MTVVRTYLDFNATVPLGTAAREAMIAAAGVGGNPSSVHAEGRMARAEIETAREMVARLVGAKPSEVVFTSGASEANSWVMAGGWDAIAVSGIEHDSVLTPARASAARLIDIPATASGTVDLAAAAARLAQETDTSARTLVSVMLANNETGVIQPVAEVVALAHEHGALVHVDAVQAPGRIAVDFAALGADLMTLSAHKMGGPRGVGALIVRDGVSLPAFIKGGGQERRRRGGTENVAGIAGFGAAASAALAHETAAAHMGRLRARIEDGVRRTTPAAVIVGNDVDRIANTTCLALPGKSAETLVIKLDLEGVAVGAGAACSSGKVGSSHVLEAMGLGPQVARSAIRVSLGPQTSEQDIAAFLAAWQKVAGDAALAA